MNSEQEGFATVCPAAAVNCFYRTNRELTETRSPVRRCKRLIATADGVGFVEGKVETQDFTLLGTRRARPATTFPPPPRVLR